MVWKRGKGEKKKEIKEKRYIERKKREPVLSEIVVSRLSAYTSKQAPDEGAMEALQG